MSLKDRIGASASASHLQGMITDRQLGYLNGLLSQVLGSNDAGNVARHQFLEHVFGSPSSKALSKAEASALIDWLSQEDRAAEIHAALKAWGEEHGQMEMEL